MYFLNNHYLIKETAAVLEKECSPRNVLVFCKITMIIQVDSIKQQDCENIFHPAISFYSGIPRNTYYLSSAVLFKLLLTAVITVEQSKYRDLVH